MSEWIIAFRHRHPSIDVEILEESALAQAQATIEGAIKVCGISRSELARRMGRPRSFVSRMLTGDHNLTIRTFSRALSACGFETKFRREPIRWGWVNEASESDEVEQGYGNCDELAKDSPPPHRLVVLAH